MWHVGKQVNESFFKRRSIYVLEYWDLKWEHQRYCILTLKTKTHTKEVYNEDSEFMRARNEMFIFVSHSTKREEIHRFYFFKQTLDIVWHVVVVSSCLAHVSALSLFDDWYEDGFRIYCFASFSGLTRPFFTSTPSHKTFQRWIRSKIKT